MVSDIHFGDIKFAFPFLFAKTLQECQGEISPNTQQQLISKSIGHMGFILIRSGRIPTGPFLQLSETKVS